MADPLLDRYVLASAGFARRLRAVRPDQWAAPTPCSEWDVRTLVNHMARGNLNYVALLAGGTGAQFLGMRDVDALGDDPVAAFARSVELCRQAFGVPDVLAQVVDYPLGRIQARQALAIRTTDSVIHTWDLARAIGADETLDASLVAWIEETVDVERFFGAQQEEPAPGASRQERLLHRMGRGGVTPPG